MTALDIIAASLADMGDLDPTDLPGCAMRTPDPCVVAPHDDLADLGVLEPSSPTRGIVRWATGEVDEAFRLDRPTPSGSWYADVAGTEYRLVVVGCDVGGVERMHRESVEADP